MNKQLLLSYKGSRNYLHGSDFFNVLMNIAEEVTEYSGSFVDRLTLRHSASRSCKLTDTKPNESEKVIGQVRYTIPFNNSQMNFWLVETDKLITNRYQFDETITLADIELDQDTRLVTLPKRSIYSPIEDIIVLTKHLNYVISPITNGSWLFGQLDLTEPLFDNYQSLEIQMKSLIEGKFSVNNVLVDNRQIGIIRFIMGENRDRY